MKSPIDKLRKRADIPTVSKQKFIAEYAAAVREFFPAWRYSEVEAGNNIDAIIAGKQPPSTLVKDLAKLHGARQGRVGNFLRGLR